MREELQELRRFKANHKDCSPPSSSSLNAKGSGACESVEQKCSCEGSDSNAREDLNSIFVPIQPEVPIEPKDNSASENSLEISNEEIVSKVLLALFNVLFKRKHLFDFKCDFCKYA